MALTVFHEPNGAAHAVYDRIESSRANAKTESSHIDLNPSPILDVIDDELRVLGHEDKIFRSKHGRALVMVMWERCSEAD
jgi:hypothetical protein